MVGYTAWSVVAFEVPTAAKWNYLGSNDDAFNTWITYKETGWVAAGVTWTYASATTFTIVGDYSGILNVGDKIRLKQGGAYKYFYVKTVVYAAGSTTITVQGGTSYTLTNAAITDNYYSKEVSPNGFPAFMAYTPTYTGFSADPNGTAIFTVTGRVCLVGFNSSTGTSNNTTFFVTAPFTAANSGTTAYNAHQFVNAGALSATAGMMQLIGSQATFILYRDWSGLAWTNSGSKYANFTLSYPI